MRAFALALSFVLFPVAANAQQGSLLELVTVAIDSAAREGARAAPAGAVTGPVLVDAGSVLRGLRTISSREFTASDILDRLSSDHVRDITGKVYHTCRTDLPPGERPTSCGVVDEGVHVRLDAISRVDSGYALVISVDWTEPRRASSAVGGAQVEYIYGYRDGEWRLLRSKILRMS